MGFSSAAANEMTMKVAANDIEGAKVIYQSAWIVVTCLSVALSFSFSLIFSFLIDYGVIPLGLLDKDIAKSTLNALFINVLISLQIGVLCAAFRATSRYAYGTFLGNLIKLFEWCIALFALYLYESILAYSIGMLIGKSIGFIAMSCCLRGGDFQIGLKLSSFKKMKDLFLPSVSFMALPISTSITLQGSVIVLSYVMGPKFIAIYVSCRTIVRTLLQAANLFNQGAWPIFSEMYGKKEYIKLQSFHTKLKKFNIFLGIGMVIGIIFSAEKILELWIGDTNYNCFPLVVSLALTTFLYLLWQADFTLLVALNRHSSITLYIVICSVIQLIVLYLILLIEGPPLAIFIAGLICELPIIFMANRQALKVNLRGLT